MSIHILIYSIICINKMYNNAYMGYGHPAESKRPTASQTIDSQIAESILADEVKRPTLK